MIVYGQSTLVHLTDCALHVFDRVMEIYEQNVRRKKALQAIEAQTQYVLVISHTMFAYVGCVAFEHALID